MHRFYTDESPFSLTEIPIGELYHQLAHVFRIRMGDQIAIFSDRTDDVIYEITGVSKKCINITQISLQKNEITPSETDVTLYLAYPHKLATLEYIIQKSVEIGVSRLVLWISDHTQSHILSPAKVSRCEKIAREALEQCGGNQLISLEFGERDFQSLYADESGSAIQHIVTDPGGNTEFPCDTTHTRHIGLWVGPEGGWSKSEKELFTTLGLPRWKCNHRVLRLETAALLACGIVLYQGMSGGNM